MVVKTYTVSTVINAPMSYVFKWCTDYRSEDYLITNSASRRHFIEKSKKKVAWITHLPSGDTMAENFRVVTLSPPSKWTVFGFGEDFNHEGSYVLKSLGRKKTQLRLAFKVDYKAAPPEPKKSWEERVSQNWEKYRAVLEQDYMSGKRPDE